MVEVGFCIEVRARDRHFKLIAIEVCSNLSVLSVCLTCWVVWCVCVTLRIKSRASHVLGQCCSTELCVS